MIENIILFLIGFAIIYAILFKSLRMEIGEAERDLESGRDNAVEPQE